MRRETIRNPRATPRFDLTVVEKDFYLTAVEKDFYLTAVEKQMHDRIWEWPGEEVKETLQAEVRNFALYFIEGYYVDRRS